MLYRLSVLTLSWVRVIESRLASRVGQRYPYQSYGQIKTSLDEKEQVLKWYRSLEHFSWDGP